MMILLYTVKMPFLKDTEQIWIHQEKSDVIWYICFILKLIKGGSPNGKLSLNINEIYAA